MSMLNLQASFFSIDNPLRLFDRWFNQFRHRKTIAIKQRKVEVRWTDRAEQVLQLGQRPLIVELQLYFSCVVKKRVIFHRQAAFSTTVVSDNLEIAFQPVASAACDPREFAASFPAGKNLSHGLAARMVPRIVELDYQRGKWTGQFRY